MPLKHELAGLVAHRIDDMDLTPLRLAELAQVRPEIVEALLRTEDTEISIAEAEKIANAVGLAIGVFGHRREKDGDAQAFNFAAQTASTSYREVVPVNVVRETLVTGLVTGDYRPHIRNLLDEASVGLLARLADERSWTYVAERRHQALGAGGLCKSCAQGISRRGRPPP